ncbi:T9SS type A sorting domain-containing protein [uncultured Aquimarina sp.]|uniref:lectin-like domain-containing protein n=1 Tax=uncultured Aquimarina sp. TaxID=575652 RepID=UPI002622763E|nr:T9SS type A sorting domain-containing protein [uncultured Aquimarina sp.]
MKYITSIIFYLLPAILVASHAQTVVNGFAMNNDARHIRDNIFELTPATNTKNGQIWFTETLDLSKDFTIDAILNFGSKGSNGADGITFTLQNECLSAGSGGGGLGISGVTPSFIVEFDTFRNFQTLSDPAEDHLAMFKNGGLDHDSSNLLSNYLGSNTVKVTNLEDGTNKTIKITWVASTKTLEVFLQSTLRLRFIGDIAGIIGNTVTYWGFTASTGASNNRQRVEVINLPDNRVTLSDQKICEGESIQNGLIGVSNPVWSPETGVSDINILNPIFSPTDTTQYTVSYQDNCNGITLNQSFTIVVDPKPSTSEINGSDNIICNTNFPEIYSVTNTTGSNYNWSVPEGATILSGQGSNEIEVEFNENSGNISVIETNSIGCTGDAKTIEVSCLTLSTVDIALNDFSVYPNPVTNNRLSVQSDKIINVIDLITISGQIIRTIKNPKLVNNTYTISNLISGLYFIRITSNKKQVFQKILVN